MMVPAFEILIGLALVVTPLLLAGLGEWLVERSGVINVAIEGAMLVGCFLAYLGTVESGSPWVGMTLGAVGGFVVALILALAHVWLRADAVVVGTALNLLALGGTGLAMQALSRAGATAIAQPLPDFALTIVAGLAAVVLGFVVHRTRLGLQLRACGENPDAARLLGVDVARIRFGALLIGGVAAGLAGAQLCLVESRTFVEGMTAGSGFMALAIVVCGRWRVFGVVVAACVFASAILLQFRFQAAGSSVPYPVFLMLPYLLTLGVLAVFAGRARPPAALGS